MGFQKPDPTTLLPRCYRRRMHGPALEKFRGYFIGLAWALRGPDREL